MSQQSAKQYFSEYLADDVVRPVNVDVVNEVLRYKPKVVFEFGCGQGKNLHLLGTTWQQRHLRKDRDKHDQIIIISGMDVSTRAVMEAHKKERTYVHFGDEERLSNITKSINWINPDVSFTCSVLDHIEHEITVDHILTDLKRMSKKAVILLETQRHTPVTYYYSHPYEEYGFKKKDNYIYYSTEASGGDGSIYFLYYWERPNRRK